MYRVLQRFFTGTSELFTTPLFEIRGTVVSLSLILHLIFALLLVIFLTRVFKHFLKQLLLVRVGIDEGNREAIAIVISYSLGTLCFLIILQNSGFNLASLAVVAGALGVGIGLGLQDITKNFISGLTLLMERKLKVGDFIEFDGLSGYVKEVSLRSTLIRTRDGGDVVVPNSNLAENRVLNWSYDSFNARIKIPAAVAYGSDPVLVTETLLNSAYMESNVLHDPPPEVIFIGFGESSLDFEVWVWVTRIDKAPNIQSSLNFIIEHNFHQQGIEIPFPQTDLWLRNPEVLAPLFRLKGESQSMPQLVQQPSQPLPKTLSIRDLLQQVTYFQNLTNLEVRRLIEIGHRKRLVESEILFREGDPGDAFYIILSGSIEVFVEKLDKHLSTLNPGEFFGELSLMLGVPRTATVRALADTVLFVINNKGFEKLLQERPELAEVIIQELGKHQEELVERQQQLRELGLVDAAEDDKNPMIWVRKRIKNLFTF